MNAFIELEDGSRFHGFSFGADASVSGEVVFSTGMVGYPESLTDPSYGGQVLVLTYPLIGNYGVPSPDKDEFGLERHFESARIQASALVVAGYSGTPSHHSSVMSLSEWLKAEGVPAIHGVDTRALTKKLREKGVMLGKVVTNGRDTPLVDPNARNLVAEVSGSEKLIYNRGGGTRVALIDCGVKNNIIRQLCRRGCEVIRVPWDYDFSDEQPDGVLISNGPGDPKMCVATIKNVAAAMDAGIPIMGICLGNQILALAAGGDTYKLKYGHRSQNQPCVQKDSGRCFITTQNHGYAVRMSSLPGDWEELFVNANDGTNEGLKHRSKPFLSVQYHPENFPGPTDTEFLFDRFMGLMKWRR